LVDEKELVVPPPTTALGALLGYITDAGRKRFQPMNVNFGLLAPLYARLHGKEKKLMMARRALADMDAWVDAIYEAEKARKIHSGSILAKAFAS
jgi:methylenetetrahydrofolate--tRNA-(uracil-5-)-methyltransferase